MKKWLLVLIYCLGGFVFAKDVVVPDGIDEDEFKRLSRAVKISGVSDDTEEDDYDEKFEVLKFYTNQGEDNEEEYTFRVRVTIEVTDKKKNSFYAQIARGQKEMDPEYNGTDTWYFWVPHGDLVKPKITAYVIEYGVLIDEKFIVLASDADDVETTEELIERTPERTDLKITQHEYEFDDGDGEIQTSMPN